MFRDAPVLVRQRRRRRRQRRQLAEVVRRQRRRQTTHDHESPEAEKVYCFLNNVMRSKLSRAIVKIEPLVFTL